MLVKDWKAMQKKLTIEAEKFLMEAYGVKLSIPVEINPRLKIVFGKFVYNNRLKESIKIEISKNYIQHQPWETVLSTLKHELIHHACFEQGMPHKDGNPYFESELKKHGSHSTGTISYKGKVVEYACSADSCTTTYERTRKLRRNGIGYVSGCCDAPLKYLGEKNI